MQNTWHPGAREELMKKTREELELISQHSSNVPPIDFLESKTVIPVYFGPKQMSHLTLLILGTFFANC